MGAYNGLTEYERGRLLELQKRYVKSGVPFDVFMQKERTKTSKGSLLRKISFKEFKYQKQGLLGSKQSARVAVRHVDEFSCELESLGYLLMDDQFCWSDGRLMVQFIYGYWVVVAPAGKVLYDTKNGRECCDFLLQREYMRLNGIRPKVDSYADRVWLDIILTG